MPRRESIKSESNIYHVIAREMRGKVYLLTMKTNSSLLIP